MVPGNADADPRKYIRLAALLRRRIQDGTLGPGDRVPSITALAAEHGGWARQTCAKALQMLEGDGLLVRVHGLGYFVTGPLSTSNDSGAAAAVLCVADLLQARGAGR
jgi:GntR family transcriptional regulator